MKPGVWAGAVLMIVLITESAAPLTYAELKVASFDPLVEQLRHFLAVIARRETPLISVEDAAGTLAVVEAVREAARTGAGISPSKITEYIA